MIIETVKEIWNNTIDKVVVGYLVNDSMSVPNEPTNRHYKEIQEWVAQGNTTAPQYTEEELAVMAQNEMITTGERLAKNQVQSIIDKYNEDHNVKFENVDSCFKYTSDSTYSNYQFCVDIIAYNIEVWEACRTIQDDIMNGNIEVPTEEEFIGLLPVYSGTV